MLKRKIERVDRKQKAFFKKKTLNLARATAKQKQRKQSHCNNLFRHKRKIGTTSRKKHGCLQAKNFKNKKSKQKKIDGKLNYKEVEP